MMALFTIYYVEMMRVQFPKIVERYHISFMIISSLVKVGVLTGEAILYWRLRKRNIYRRESWAHVLILVLAFVLPLLENVFILFLGKAVNISDVNKMRSTFYVQQGLYWALIVLAHIFFARVLIQCYSKSSSVVEGDGVNLLDDVEIYS